MFDQFVTQQWLNVLIWTWQITVICLNVPRWILHTFFAPFATANIMGVPDDQANDTTYFFMRNLGVNQFMTIVWETLALIFGTKEIQLMIFSMMIFEAIASIIYNNVGKVVGLIAPDYAWGTPSYAEENSESQSLLGVDVPGFIIYMLTVPPDLLFLSLMAYGIYF